MRGDCFVAGQRALWRGPSPYIPHPLWSRAMTPADAQCLDAFPIWLEQLAADALDLLALVLDEEVAERQRLAAATSLNYLLKSLDLIPDGVQDLGLLDDAFVLRVCMTSGFEATADLPPLLARLRAECSLLESFLSDDFARLLRYCVELRTEPVRGRAPADIVNDPVVNLAFAEDVRAWAASYRAPLFPRDDKNLVKLRSFLRTKLPGAEG